MKTLKYIALSLLVAASTTACKDDPELLTTDVGPEMTVVSADASGVYGGKVDFEVTMTDRYALSTLKAQVFFDDEMVAEEVIRTKSDGTYTGAVTLPFYKNIPDGEATLRFVGQNVRFGTTTVDRPLAVSRPKPAYLTFFLDDAEYRMEPTGNDYEYAVTDEFPQKPQGYIATPELDAAGSVVTFGYDSGAGGIVSDSTDAIPFANSNAGEFTITFNLLTFEGSPFIKLLFGETEMTMVDNDNYSIVTTLTKEAMPLLRYRTRDICILRHEDCPCGRTHIKMCKPMGRSDDMLIVKGVNVFPSQIETVLLEQGYTSNYQIVVDRVNNSDTLDVLVEMTPEHFSDSLAEITQREKSLVAALKAMLGIFAQVHLVSPKSIARSEGKAIRVIDKRRI